VPLRPPHNPRGLDLEPNSGLSGERLTFYRLTVVSDALCTVRRAIPTSTNNFSLHHSSHTAFCAPPDSHTAPPSPLTATPPSHNSICVSGVQLAVPKRSRLLANLTLQRSGFASKQIHVTLVVGEVSLRQVSLPVSIIPPVLHTDVHATYCNVQTCFSPLALW